MAFDRFLIGPMSVGLETDLKPWAIPDQAYAQLKNAYVFRGRVRKRFGSRLISSDQRFSRFRIALTGGAGVGITDGAGNATGTVPGAVFKVGQMFSIGTALYTVTSSAAGAQPMLQTVVTTTATYNIGTGVYNFVGAPATTQVYFYPAEPVMGLDLYEKGSVTNHPAYGFDTQFAYVFSGTAWERSVTAGTPVWRGTNANFFWVTNWEAIIDNVISLFVSNFFVTNPNGATTANDDPIWTFKDATGWEVFTPQFLTAGDFVETARIILPFHDRLILLNTIEVSGGNNKNYVNRCRFSQNGSPFEGGLPFCATAWLEQTQAGSHQAGYIDATTEEEIVTAEFIKDRLIVYFERSTWELAYTGNEIQPFIWQKLNTELGSESTFSTVPFDREVLTVGTTGVHACNGSNVQRIDNLIPDQIFNVRNINAGPARVAGIRDYFTEMVYWSYPDSAQASTQTYPNQILVYNYKNQSWAINDDCITAFGYFEQQTGLTWATATFSWASTSSTWSSGTNQAQSRKIIAGNQQGFMFLIEPDSNTNANAMQLTNITFDAGPSEMELTIIDHTLTDNEFVRITGAQGVTITGNGIYEVTRVVNANTIRVFLPSGSFVGVYTGGGTVARASQIDILTKQWNFYNNQGKNVYIQKVDFNVDKTSSGQITVDYYPSTTELSMITQAAASGAALGTSILETSPFALEPLEQQQDQLWHPVFLQSDGQTIQLRIYMSPAQMIIPQVSEATFELNAMVLYAQPISRLQ